MATPAILEPDGRPTSATTFLVVHRALRRDLARYPAAVRQLAMAPEEVRLAAFRDHWKSSRELLDAHHEQEDKVLFPELRELAPGLGDLLDALDTKHVELTSLLDTVSSWVEQLPEEVDQTAAAFEELAEFLVFHLDTEEAHLVPVMLSSLESPGQPEPAETSETAETAPAPDAPETVDAPEPATSEMGDVDRLGFGGVPPSFALPWSAEGLDAGTAQVLLAMLPEPLQAGFPTWQQAYQQSVSLWAPS